MVFSHGWPLSADAFEDQMFFLASRGYRCIAHDRRGHGRSSQPWNGNDMDTYADDLAALVEALDLKKAIHVGHSTGGGEVARYIGRHGTKRVAKAVLIGAVPPLMLKTAANPGGLPIEVFDQLRASVLADRSQFWKDLSMPFYGYNRPGAKISEGVRESFWLQGMMAGFPAAYFCIKAFSETDLTEDLKKFDVPTLILHGDDDQIVPIGASALLSSKIVKGATLENLSGRAARHVHDPQGPGQRRSARLPENVRPQGKGKDWAAQRGEEVFMNPGRDSGIIDIPGKHSVDETVEKLKGILQAKGVTLFALVDHSGEAQKVGLEMRPTKLLIFGSPKAGTPVMLAAPSSAIDLPLKILVWEDGKNKVWISYNSQEYLQKRHGLPQELLANLAVVETLAAKAAE